MTRGLTDSSEKALEQLIVCHLAGISESPSVAAKTVQEPEAISGRLAGIGRSNLLQPQRGVGCGAV